VSVFGLLQKVPILEFAPLEGTAAEHPQCTQAMSHKTHDVLIEIITILWC